MNKVDTVKALRQQVRDWRSAGHRIGFVPTMGNLHAGHLELVQEALRRADRVVVSIFVNPLQFAPGEDYDRYPRTLEQDCVALERLGVQLVFAPPVEAIYPAAGDLVRVSVPGIGNILEGACRPGFFTGVATVVCKLFNLVEPDLAVFGEKDYQQLVVLRRLVRDLDFPIEIIAVPTAREADGLALSSRNQYLDAAERRLAPQLYSELRRCAESLLQGRRDFAGLEQETQERLTRAGMQPDYVSIRRARDLAEPSPADSGLVVLAAAWLGRTRLIDNLLIS